MRRPKLWHIVAAFSLCLGLSACNTTDALTPQVDVGGGTYPSSAPVTQEETDRMAGTDRLEPVQSAPLASPGNSRGAPNIGNQPGGNDTLSAQARALDAGDRVSPASSGPPPAWQGQEELSQGSGQPDDAAPPQAAPPGGQTAAASGSDTIRFLPIIGAPVQAVTPLSRQLAASARAAGLTIRPSGDTSTNQILKGYFSALSNGDKVTMVYVWDVLDNSGARLHRMQGQETMAAEGSDPWDAVSPELMQSIATKTIAEYMSWRRAG